MPDLNEFLNNKEQKEALRSTLESLEGIRPCSKCELDVDGGFWDPESLTMQWTCSNGHETKHQVG
jgi:hypothetical protein